MAIDDFYRALTFDTSMQMLQQDMLTNAYFYGSPVGANLRAMILGRQPVQPLTNPFDEAITGRLRSDSAVIRQNARNVTEASSMMGVAKEAVATIKSTLKEMESLAKAVKEGDLTYSAGVAAEYNALRDKITAIIEDTEYNGIALLDGGRWGTDQIDAQGNVFVQAFLNGGFNTTFRALDEVAWSDLKGGDLDPADSAKLQAQIDTLSGFVGDMGTVEDIYSNRQSGLESQGTALRAQAELLDQAVEARRHTPALSLEEIILRLLFGSSGSLLNQTG
ncbi:MAG: hypothetical protein EOM25_12900 [Deltaproteobacteria bacterium]|nr:hypothetical protein [Deltaproteobacteria bacterium]